MIVTEKIAYLKGLVEGLKIDTATNEGKLLTEIINALELIAFELEDQNEQIEELDSYIDEVDQDLSYVEETLFGADEDDYDDDDYDDYYIDDEDEDDDVVYEGCCAHADKDEQ